MRDVQKLWETWRSGKYVGANRPCTRVTVEESFELHTTGPVVGQWDRGPARWYQRKDLTQQIETEIPGVTNISINRSTEPDAGTCDITIRNVLGPIPGAPETPVGQLGDIGYYTPERGESQDAAARWGHAINPWHRVLAPNALIRTYQGFGGHEKLLRQAVADGDIVLNGVWLVDDVTINTDGTLGLKCRDMAKLLIDQQLVPPLVPAELYPLTYKRYELKKFDIPKDPPPGTAIYCPGARYAVGPYYPGGPDGWHSSTDETYGQYDTGATGHPPSHAFDLAPGSMGADGWIPPSLEWWNKEKTFWLSEPKGSPNDTVWIEFDVPSDLPFINEVYCKAWKTVMEGRGSHLVQVSIVEYGDWVAEVPWGLAHPGYTAQGIPYVDWFTPGTEMVPGKSPDRFRLPRDYYATRVRFTVTNLMWADDFPRFSDADFHGGGYRGGIREAMACNNAAYTMYPPLVFSAVGIPYNKENTLGYWQVVSNGHLYAFGDARTYPANGGMTHVGPTAAMCVHPSMQGYWTIDNSGRVISYGQAQHYGDPFFDVDPYYQWVDIAPTPSGNGYWTLRGDGYIRAYGDAQDLGSSHHEAQNPTNEWKTFAQSIDSHPEHQGYWVMWQDGFVDTKNVSHYGNGDREGLFPAEWYTAFKRTHTGNGYWLLSGTGKVKNKGDAKHYGNGAPKVYDTANWFRPLYWEIIPSATGDGYLLQRLDGSLNGHGTFADFGSIAGGQGQLRYDGNYKDYTDIIRDLLLWSGFYLQRDDQPEGEQPDVYGNLETTGIYSTNDPLPTEMFDKRPVIDAIRDIRAVVNYAFFIDAEGAVRWEAPNWWQMGNFLIDGTPFGYMPEIDEKVQLTSHVVTRSAQTALSEIIIATEWPYSTVNGQKLPDGIVKTRIEGSTKPDLRGIIKPGIWRNGQFLNPDEQRTMAELLDMQIWFQRRTASVQCVANPLIDVNDQVRIIERQTGDVFIHYIKAITFNHDLKSGEFTMSLTTHWLGGTPYGQLHLFYACANRPQDDGYWQIAANGDIYTFGKAELFPRHEADSHLSTPIALRATPSGEGYWSLDQNGKVLSYGDATNFGDLDLNAKVAIDLAVTPSGQGYWILLTNGAVRGFGDAVYYGDATPSLGVTARAIESHPTIMGYWVLQSNGTVDAFNLPFYDNANRDGFKPTEFTSRLRRSASGNGYRIVSTSGIMQSFGDAADLGNATAQPEGPLGMVWDFLTNADDGYAIQRADGTFETFEFPGTGLARGSNFNLQWALVTEDIHRELSDPTAAYAVSARVIDFLKGTSSPSANNAAANGFNAPNIAALEGSTVT